MVKQVIIGGLAIAILVIGGVLEVKVHPDQLSEVPGRVMAFVGKPETASKARALFADLKRRREQLIVRDEAKRTELALLYVEQDAHRLDELIADEAADAATVLPQAELLQKSMDRLQAQLGKAPIDALVELRSKSRESLASAQAAFTKLQAQQERYAALQERFTAVTDAIKEGLAALGQDEEDTSSVAGTRDDKQTTSTPTPEKQPSSSAIPLEF